MQVGLLRPSTPGAGLDVATDTTPLHLHIKSEAMMARVRTADRVGASWEKVKPDKEPKSHISRLEHELTYAKVPRIRLDKIPQEWNSDNKFLVDMASLNKGTIKNDNETLEVK